MKGKSHNQEKDPLLYMTSTEAKNID